MISAFRRTCSAPLGRQKNNLSFRYCSQLAHEFRRASEERQRDNVYQLFRSDKSNPMDHNKGDEGLFYPLPEEDVQRLFQRRIKSEFINTMKEVYLMVRRPALEVMDTLRASNFNCPALKFILYGESGTGKTLSLMHITHFCVRAGWFLVHVPWPSWVMYPKECSVSPHHQDLFDLPVEAMDWLAHCKSQNYRLLHELKTGQTYTWSKREITEAGKPLLEVVEQGLNRGKYASDCVAVVLKEARRQANDKKCRVLVVVDGVNGLWRESALRDDHKRFVPSEKLSLIHHFKQMIGTDWENGAIITSVDTKAFRPHLREQSSPLYLLGEQGFDLLNPFIPIPVTNYSEKELYSCLEYYKSQQWIQHDRGMTEDGWQEIVFKSGKNPFLIHKAVASL